MRFTVQLQAGLFLVLFLLAVFVQFGSLRSSQQPVPPARTQSLMPPGGAPSREYIVLNTMPPRRGR